MGISLVAILLIINSSRGQQFVFHYPQTPKRREDVEIYDELLENDVIIWPYGNIDKDSGYDDKRNIENIVEYDHSNISNKLFGFETGLLGSILCPKVQGSSKFQLSIDDLTFVGRPVFLESTAATDESSMDDSSNQNSGEPNDHNNISSKTGRLTFFHLVFVLEPLELELERQVDNIYKHVVTKLTAAFEYEQIRSNYVWKEAEMILSLKENSGITSSDELMEVILNKSTLARTIQQVYDSISIDSIAHVMVNDYIDLSLQVSPLAPTFQSTEGDMTDHEYDHYPIIAPYHTLLLLEDPEEILRSIPIDANPTLVNLIQILTPTKRLVDLCTMLDCSLAQIYRIAAHLIYWRKAKIIDVVNIRNTYIVSPTADMSKLPTYIEYFKQHFPADLDLVKILSALSSSKPYLINANVFKANRAMFLEAITFLLRKEFVVQLHAYVFFMVPQYIKKGLTKEEYERQKNLRENGDDPNVEDINGVIDGDTALISPYEEATKVEKEWLKQFVTHEAQATLFEKLIKYFNGKHHTEEIVFRENIKPRELGKILNLMGVASKIVWC